MCVIKSLGKLKMEANSGDRGKRDVEITSMRRSSNILFLKLDFKNLCILVLYIWHTHGITNINKSIKK